MTVLTSTIKNMGVYIRILNRFKNVNCILDIKTMLLKMRVDEAHMAHKMMVLIKTIR